MQPDKLVMMANQIGTFFKSQKKEDTVHSIADHMRKFWDPRMRAAILELAKAGGDDLQPEVRLALQQLSEAQERQAEPAAIHKPSTKENGREGHT
jgi:formate dehydrogenase subunit delta